MFATVLSFARFTGQGIINRTEIIRVEYLNTPLFTQSLTLSIVLYTRWPKTRNAIGKLVNITSPGNLLCNYHKTLQENIVLSVGTHNEIFNIHNIVPSLDPMYCFVSIIKINNVLNVSNYVNNIAPVYNLVPRHIICIE